MDTMSQTVDFAATDATARTLAKLPTRRGGGHLDAAKIPAGELPDLIAFFVATGVLTAAQAQTIVDALNDPSGPVPVLPDLPGDLEVSIYPALQAFVASIETDSWFDDLVDWVVEHAAEIYEVVMTVASWIE